MKNIFLLLEEFRKKSQPINPIKIEFIGVDGFDVYNITAEFEFEDEKMIVGRVEKRDSENSKIKFFVKNEDGKYELKPNSPTFELQDPIVTFIDNEIIVGGVQISPHPDNADALQWKTIYLKGTKLDNLTQFFEGPIGMKDIRLIQLPNKKIGVFTRPQGKIGGRGKIGFYIADNLEDITIEKINKAPLFNQFNDDEWGGVNEIHVLKNGKLGVLGHYAVFTEIENRHYYSMVFCVDPTTLECSEIEIIAERKNFLDGEFKREDLKDVIFSGGLVTKGNKATLYAGISDAEAQYITIDNPFLKYE
jgi:hypothetical protein